MLAGSDVNVNVGTAGTWIIQGGDFTSTNTVAAPGSWTVSGAAVVTLGGSFNSQMTTTSTGLLTFGPAISTMFGTVNLNTGSVCAFQSTNLSPVSPGGFKVGGGHLILQTGSSLGGDANTVSSGTLTVSAGALAGTTTAHYLCVC